MERANLSKKEYNVMIVMMIKELERRMEEQNEKLDVFNREL